jgi:DNA polymerase-3 subunit alpha
VANSPDSFVHLHVHSEYSMLDGAARVAPLVTAAAEQGMPAIAVTDHGNMFGAYEFWQKATAAGIKPIIGTEAYITPGTARGDKTRIRWGASTQSSDDVGGSGAYTHMTLQGRHRDDGMRGWRGADPPPARTVRRGAEGRIRLP